MPTQAFVNIKKERRCLNNVATGTLSILEHIEMLQEVALLFHCVLIITYEITDLSANALFKSVACNTAL